jgi:hypothetical protein
MRAPRARTFLAACSLGLMACSAQECEAFHDSLRDFFIFVLLLLLLAFVVQVASLVILVVGIVKLVNGTPSTRWGIAAIVSGVVVEIPMLAMLAQPNPLHLLTLFGVALLYVGIRNVQQARPSAMLPPPPPA